MKIREKPKKKEINILVISYIVLVVVFLSYFMTSYLRYKALSKEYETLKNAYEQERRQYKELEKMIEKLQRIVENNMENERNENQNGNREENKEVTDTTDGTSTQGN
ncbi:MAG: hypothetical protein WHS64_01875 [Fervidobacterium sp.]|uniref:Uncharacterized protein n=1 Tax=Fervidobacterium gondwanense DSM 13020 TaxID=1121883 RepID=A0A1M7RWN2_FERGO|nr:hypothetical protein [Fervidobacterium gondwanense]UXF00043.1 hypothetical protein IB67_00135 [Fervidobacterium riparium]SHN50524.1 hypothetical protein SAMN02745226_00254 [Fervidobacterium gondwanense DSM 13020]